MSTHTKLTKEERIEIATFLKAGCSQTQIAYHLNKSKSTISREITRNKDPVTGEYRYSLAHRLTKQRKVLANKLRSKITADSKLERYIIKHLKRDWSPEQIAGRKKGSLNQ
jgi:transposase, IS30 family